MSLKADLRARMRAYKLRGQGNGNAQAATYNETVRAESMGVDFEGDHEWTTGESEVWVGNKVRFFLLFLPLSRRLTDLDFM
jgi:actin-related protein 8